MGRARSQNVTIVSGFDSLLGPRRGSAVAQAARDSAERRELVLSEIAGSARMQVADREFLTRIYELGVVAGDEFYPQLRETLITSLSGPRFGFTNFSLPARDQALMLLDTADQEFLTGAGCVMLETYAFVAREHASCRELANAVDRIYAEEHFAWLHCFAELTAAIATQVASSARSAPRFAAQEDKDLLVLAVVGALTRAPPPQITGDLAPFIDALCTHIDQGQHSEREIEALTDLLKRRGGKRNGVSAALAPIADALTRSQPVSA